jgi:mannose-6-phosphate isomerase-like protein (cupin superfamily)
LTGFFTDIEKKSGGNDNFREVIYTGPNSQLVLMSLKPGEDIGMEVNPGADQFIRIEEGQCAAVLDDKEFHLETGSAIIVLAGSRHNILNTSKTGQMKFYMVYSPPYFPDGAIHRKPW